MAESPNKINRKGKLVAGRHSEVAESAKSKGYNTLTSPIPAPEKKNVARIMLIKPTEKQIELLKEQVGGDLIDYVEIVDSKIFVKTTDKKVDAVLDFLKDNGIRNAATEDIKDIKDAEEVDEIIDEVQSKRKPQAIARDNAKTAQKVGDKTIAQDLLNWLQKPGKSDLEGVDTEK